ncbi:MAG TPA: hypothetical protein VMB48_03515 [Steroidobacteraceae bacterium]|nr:hypothetical protein [Steroidobacteraceae bacterium]
MPKYAPTIPLVLSITAFVLGLVDSDRSVAAAPSNSTSVTPSAGDDIKPGDIIKFTTDAGIFQLAPVPRGADAAGTPAPTTNYLCAPAKERFEVQTITAATTTPALSNAGAASSTPAHTALATPADTALVTGYFPSGFRLFHHRNVDPYKSRGGKSTNADKGTNGSPTVTTGDPDPHPACLKEQWIHLDTLYQFSERDFGNVGSQRQGFTWGPLIIPYKFYFSDHSLKANSSTVMYVGYEGWFPGVSVALVGAAGLGISQDSSSSSSSTGGTTTGGTEGTTTTTPASSVTNATGTLAVGVISSFGGGAIKAGLLFGRDYQSNATTFKYENKTWMAISVGTSL